MTEERLDKIERDIKEINEHVITQIAEQKHKPYNS